MLEKLKTAGFRRTVGEKVGCSALSFRRIAAKISFICLITNINDGMIAPC